jgi:hypothetical protein
MQTSLKLLQIVRAAMLASIVLYVVIARALPARPSPDPIVLYVIALSSIMFVVAIIFLRQLLVSRSEAVLLTHPDDTKALSQWRTGYLLAYCLSESIALFGVVLSTLGFALRQATPFYIAGFVLVLFSRPRIPSNEIG